MGDKIKRYAFFVVCLCVIILMIGFRLKKNIYIEKKDYGDKADVIESKSSSDKQNNKKKKMTTKVKLEKSGLGMENEDSALRYSIKTIKKIKKDKVILYVINCSLLNNSHMKNEKVHISDFVNKISVKSGKKEQKIKVKVKDRILKSKEKINIKLYAAFDKKDVDNNKKIKIYHTTKDVDENNIYIYKTEIEGEV